MDAEYWEKEQPLFLKSPKVSEPPDSKKETQNPALDDPYPAVPSELKTLPQWVLWKAERRNGKPTKIPKQITGGNAKANDPSTWGEYQTAYRAVTAKNGKVDGIGFVFSPNDDYTGIDLDNCLDSEGHVSDWAKPLVERLKRVAYGEVSPSGKGIKFWMSARLPNLTKHKVYIDEATGAAIEAYDSGRFFTVTGRGTGQIGNGQGVVDWLAAEYLKPQPKPQKKKNVQQSNLNSAEEVIDSVRQSRQCHKFDALMRGDLTGYGSHSEADLALCCVISFWTQDTTVIDAIFRQSQLYREKWDERHRSDGATYGEMTMEEALSGTRQTYTPPVKRRTRNRTRRRFQWV